MNDEMYKIYQNECQKMAREGTLTQERQLVAMMLYLPQDYIKKQLKDKLK